MDLRRVQRLSMALGALAFAGACTVGDPGVVSDPGPGTDGLGQRLAAGGTHTCGVDASGSVWCWGTGTSGELGAAGVIRGVPTAVSGGHVFDAVSAGGTHSCALDGAGRAWCWGLASWGRLGDGRDEEWEGWDGEPRAFAPVAVTGDHAFEAISAGESHTCALDRAGKAWCWGDNGYSQLGIGDERSAHEVAPTAVRGDRKYSAISAGDPFTCALDIAGRAWCWGWQADDWPPNEGTMGEYQTSPVMVQGGRRFTSIAVAVGHACARDASRRAWCWGNDDLGQLGDGTAGGDAVWEPAPVAGGHRFSAVSGSCAIDEQGRAWCWGAGEQGQLGEGPGSEAAADSPVAVAGSERLAAVSSGPDHACALSESGVAWCWGNNHHRQVGSGQNADDTAFTPQPVDAKQVFTAVSTGRAHSCALDAGGQAWCWGSDVSGQLGAGAAGANTGLPVRVEGLPGATSVAASWNHSCAVDAGGQAWCWGSDDSGQLGNGNNTAPNVFFPTAVVGSHVFAAVTTGVSHTCALDKDGQAWCWGDGAFGVLGAGYLESDSDSDSGAVTERSPVAVAGEHVFARITAGGHHSCALDSGGAAWCWGLAQDGQLGGGPGEGGGYIPEANTPQAVAGGHHFTAISGGGAHTCALDDRGSAWCWGKDVSGQLGVGAERRADDDSTYLPNPTPLQVSGGPSLETISAGEVHTCALDRAGHAWCWGNNESGQLGNGHVASDSEKPQSTPTPVTGDHSFVAIAAGAEHTCAVDTAGQPWCWGRNDQLGGTQGTATTQALRPTPVRVEGTETFDSA